MCFNASRGVAPIKSAYLEANALRLDLATSGSTPNLMAYVTNEWEGAFVVAPVEAPARRLPGPIAFEEDLHDVRTLTPVQVRDKDRLTQLLHYK